MTREAALPERTYQTRRLRMRGWRDSDLAPFAALNADPEVMEFMPKVATRAESDLWVRERVVAHFDAYGYGVWAVDRLDAETFIGFVGLMWQTFQAPFTPALEVGWRLARSQWGEGYATEAAERALSVAFEELQQPEVVSMTSPQNERSRAVMSRLGMTRDPADDFDHPRLPEGHRLRRHVLYRISASRWRERHPRG